MSKSKKITLKLPSYGRSTELLRKFASKQFHGELVVTLNWQGEIELTVYSIQRESNGDLKHISYRIA